MSTSDKDISSNVKKTPEKKQSLILLGLRNIANVIPKFIFQFLHYLCFLHDLREIFFFFFLLHLDPSPQGVFTSCLCLLNGRR